MSNEIFTEKHTIFNSPNKQITKKIKFEKNLPTKLKKFLIQKFYYKVEECLEDKKETSST